MDSCVDYLIDRAMSCDGDDYDEDYEESKDFVEIENIRN